MLPWILSCFSFLKNSWTLRFYVYFGPTLRHGFQGAYITFSVNADTIWNQAEVSSETMQNAWSWVLNNSVCLIWCRDLKRLRNNSTCHTSIALTFKHRIEHSWIEPLWPFEHSVVFTSIFRYFRNQIQPELSSALAFTVRERISPIPDFPKYWPGSLDVFYPKINTAKKLMQKEGITSYKRTLSQSPTWNIPPIFSLLSQNFCIELQLQRWACIQR